MKLLEEISAIHSVMRECRSKFLGLALQNCNKKAEKAQIISKHFVTLFQKCTIKAEVDKHMYLGF